MIASIIRASKLLIVVNNRIPIILVLIRTRILVIGDTSSFLTLACESLVISYVSYSPAW